VTTKGDIAAASTAAVPEKQRQQRQEGSARRRRTVGTAALETINLNFTEQISIAL
jgi:hypothetical protein